MLKLTINKNNLKKEIQKINPVDMFYYGDNKIAIITEHAHNLKKNSEVVLQRYDDIGELLFNENTEVEVLDEKNFLIPSFGEEFVEVTNCEKIEIYSPIKGKKIKLLKFTTNGCNLFTKRSQTIKNAYSNKNYINNFCQNDFILYNDIFLLKYINSDELKYENKIYNTKEEFYLNYWGDVRKINIFVGVNFDGSDYNKNLYWEYEDDDEEYVNSLIDKFSIFYFYFRDTRFFGLVDGNLDFRRDFEGNIDVSFHTVKNEIDINLNINENYDVSLLKNEYYNNFYVNEKINENINNVVDMEKQIFIPRLYNINTKKHNNGLINDINFKINVRKRPKGWSTTELSNEWYSGSSETGNTNITDIGFDEEDIKYQKSSLRKSFLRISFYDTPNRGNQKLLYYSTVFLDVNKIFNDYFTKGYISDLEFNIKNSFNNTACSEGYYLYLFPKWGKTNIPTEIYMKIEFNHAKFGKTVSLVLPSNDDFKNGYIGINDENGEGINKLFNDLYIKVNTMYDSESNKYIWFIPNDKVNDNTNKAITMTLYEPIVNKINESGNN